jgi:hypothetical protein
MLQIADDYENLATEPKSAQVSPGKPMAFEMRAGSA